MPDTILITHSSFARRNTAPADTLRAAGYALRYVTAEELQQELPDVVGMVVGLQRITADIMDRAPRLRAIARFGVGTDNIDIAAATSRGIIVTNAPGVNAAAVAELALGLMIDMSRRISLVDRRVRSGVWRGHVGTELSGKTLGIVGAGAIGRRLVKLVQGFDMRVLAATRTPDHEWARANSVSIVDLPVLLREADYVSLHVPLTPQTRSLMGEAELDQMKPTAILINTSRGEIVDEQALISALQSGVIAGAGLDVFQSEPPVDSPLLSMDNVVLTSHIGGASAEAFHAAAQIASENLLDALQGRVPKHVVNPEVLARRR